MCVNNLPKMLRESGTAEVRTGDILSRKSNALTTTPLGHTSMYWGWATAIRPFVCLSFSCWKSSPAEIAETTKVLYSKTITTVYGHNAGQPALAVSPVNNWRISSEQLLPTCLCWWQLMHLVQEEDARVLLIDVTYLHSLHRFTFSRQYVKNQTRLVYSYKRA